MLSVWNMREIYFIPEAHQKEGTEAQRRKGTEAQRRKGAKAQRRKGAVVFNFYPTFLMRLPSIRSISRVFSLIFQSHDWKQILDGKQSSIGFVVHIMIHWRSAKSEKLWIQVGGKAG